MTIIQSLSKAWNKVCSAVGQAVKKTMPLAQEMINKSFRFLLDALRSYLGELTLALVAALAKKFAFKKVKAVV